jgi:putative transcriptional regulator
MKRIGPDIIASLREAAAFARGAADARRFRVYVPPEVDLRSLRRSLGLSQAEFCLRFGFNVNTLRHWEQGRRRPEGPARAFLQVIAREPRAVQRALAAARREARRPASRLVRRKDA